MSCSIILTIWVRVSKGSDAASCEQKNIIDVRSSGYHCLRFPEVVSKHFCCATLAHSDTTSVLSKWPSNLGIALYSSSSNAVITFMCSVELSTHTAFGKVCKVLYSSTILVHPPSSGVSLAEFGLLNLHGGRTYPRVGGSWDVMLQEPSYSAEG